MKKLQEFWFRIWIRAPDYFRRMKKWALLLIALMTTINTVAPELDVILIQLYKGSEHQKTIWLSHFIAALSAGIAFAAGQVVQDYGTLENKIKNKQ